MTLMDFFNLIRKNWKLVLVTMLICGTAGFVFAMLKFNAAGGFSATANIVGNSQTGGVMSLVTAEGRQIETSDGFLLSDEDCEYELAAQVEPGTQTVSVTVSGPDEEECLRLANDIAEAASRKAVQNYLNWENPYIGFVEKASEADVEVEKPSKKFVALGILGGLFLGICIVVLIDMMRRPVKSIEGMQNATGLPVLEKLPVTDGNRLLANVRFASRKQDLERVCIIPVGQKALALEVASLLDSAMMAESDDSADKHDSFQTVACNPLSQSMDAAYNARKADAAIIVTQQWEDSLTELESTVAELKLAEANLAGLVYAEHK